ncbi:hypothetical protein ONZ45_g9377 [Pleurotus djamor]|nr:hypothetical protein ONZ45_g9377 [Pleurotus djamor]
MAFSLQPPPPPRTESSAFDDSDVDTASERSISLSSPPSSPRHSRSFPPATTSESSKRTSNPRTLDTDLDNIYNHEQKRDSRPSPSTSLTPSIYDNDDIAKSTSLPTYPPSPPDLSMRDTDSIASFASTSSRKARPESLIMNLEGSPLVLGVGLVDFNHLVRI